MTRGRRLPVSRGRGLTCAAQRLPPRHGVGTETLSLVDAANRLVRLRGFSGDKLRFGNAKLLPDESFQGVTACLLQRGDYGDQPHGIRAVDPKESHRAFENFRRSGHLVHARCNGDRPTRLFLDALKAIRCRYPRPDHRQTCTHTPVSTGALFGRPAALGACGNEFNNHFRACGDQPAGITLEPRGQNECGRDGAATGGCRFPCTPTAR